MAATMGMKRSQERVWHGLRNYPFWNSGFPRPLFSSLVDCLIGVDTDRRTVSRLCFRNSERVIRLDMW